MIITVTVPLTVTVTLTQLQPFDYVHGERVAVVMPHSGKAEP